MDPLKEPTDVRIAALRGLARRRDPRVVEIAERFLQSTDTELREEALIALGTLRSAEGLALLRRLWAQEGLSNTERIITGIMMGRHIDKAVESFLELQLRQDNDWKIPIAIALADMGNRCGRRELRRALESANISEKLRARISTW